MYTPCLPLTSSDEYVHAVGQYMKAFCFNSKIGTGGGGVVKKRESDLRCHSFSTDGDRKRFQCKQIFHKI